MKFTVVVTVFEREHLVPNILHCLAAQRHEDWDAVFVEDGPHPQAREMVTKFTDQSELPISYRSTPRAPKRFGNAARRKGLEVATGDFVCFVGHDCLIDPDYLHAHDRAIRSKPYPPVSVVQCRYWTLRRRNGQPRAVPKYGGILPADPDPDSWRMGNIDLTCIAFPRELARNVGVFDESMQWKYAADWHSFSAVREFAPAVFTPRVVCAHF